MQIDSQAAVNGDGGRVADSWKRGTKRDASDSNLSDFERFEKRLRMLSLRNSEQNGNRRKKLYTPVSNAPAGAAVNGLSHANHVQTPLQDELMQVDDKRDKVYIHDLDAELADIESDDEKLIFLPDIERRLSKVPQQLLRGGDDHGNQELVLYSVPQSLTVDEDHDSVRKAIIESRQRAREKAAEEARHEDMNRQYDQSAYTGPAETAHGYNAGYAKEPDPDAMDIG